MWAGVEMGLWVKTACKVSPWKDSTKKVASCDALVTFPVRSTILSIVANHANGFKGSSFGEMGYGNDGKQEFCIRMCISLDFQTLMEHWNGNVVENSN